MEDIKGKFSEFISPNYFSRVDRHHILEIHIGLDEKSRKSIELRSNFIPQKVTGTSAIEVSQYRKTEYNTIRFSLKDDEISGLFYTFCDDLIEQTRSLKEKNEGYQAIVNRFYQWKKLFIAPKKLYLTEPEIMGLIGEILFMRSDLANAIGLSDALKSWSGQELTHKDFSYKNTWFEVKTINRSSQTVKISSLEQLDGEANGELAVYVLEKMSEAYNGITLNRLVIETQAMFGSQEEKEDFLAKVALQGYEYSDYYDDFVYELCNMIKYIISPTFPKLTRQNIPDAIRKVTYELSLIDIAQFEIKR